jgi:hypothetical protein
MVGQAATVQASRDATVSVCPDSANAPTQVLQSARVDTRSFVKVKVYMAPAGSACSVCVLGWIDTSFQVPASPSAVRVCVPPPADEGDVGEDGESEHPMANDEAMMRAINKRELGIRICSCARSDSTTWPRARCGSRGPRSLEPKSFGHQLTGRATLLTLPARCRELPLL